MSEKPDAPMSEEERADRLERMVDTLAGTIVDLKAENAALRQPLRERDVLWCKALIATLDARQIEAVTRHFNEHRPDAATEETRALLAALRRAGSVVKEHAPDCEARFEDRLEGTKCTCGRDG